MNSALKCWRKDSAKPKLSSLKEKPQDQPMLSKEVLDNLNRLIYRILIKLWLVICNLIYVETIACSS